MTVVSPPVSVSSVKTMPSPISPARPVPAEARAEGDADANRRNKDRRTRRRWRRIVITRSRSLVRLNHICAGVGAHRCSKSQRQQCQSHYETFLSHNSKSSSCCFGDLTRRRRGSFQGNRNFRRSSTAARETTSFQRTGCTFRIPCLSFGPRERSETQQNKARNAV